MLKSQIKNSIRVACFTVVDLLKLRSLYLLFTVFLLVIIIGTGIKNPTEHSARFRFAQLLYFHIISTGALLFTVLLSMEAIRKDIEAGRILMYLSCQVSRTSYLFGRLAGINIVVFLFMFFLHISLSVKITMQTGVFPGGIPEASIICVLCNMFLSGLIVLISFFTPGFIAAMVGLFVAGTSFFIDTIHMIMNSELVNGLLKNSIDKTNWFKAIWPKIFAFQYQIGNLIKNEDNLHQISMYPLINLVFYLFLVYLAMMVIFNKKDLNFES